jgi:hypothetical protein
MLLERETLFSKRSVKSGQNRKIIPGCFHETGNVLASSLAVRVASKAGVRASGRIADLKTWAMRSATWLRSIQEIGRTRLEIFKTFPPREYNITLDLATTFMRPRRDTAPAGD